MPRASSFSLGGGSFERRTLVAFEGPDAEGSVGVSMGLLRAATSASTPLCQFAYKLGEVGANIITMHLDLDSARVDTVLKLRVEVTHQEKAFLNLFIRFLHQKKR